MEEVVTLASIGNGACLELFQVALQRVIANIGDVQTSSKARREINIKVIITPDEDRNIGFTAIQVTSKLAHAKPVSGTLYFGHRPKDGKEEYYAVTNNASAPSLFDEKSGALVPLTPLTERIP